MRQSLMNKGDLATRSNKQMFWSDGSVLWRKENSSINKTAWLKNNLILKRKKGVVPELWGSTASPFSTVMISPSGFSSCFPGPTISSSFTNFCTCSTLWEEEWQKLLSYVTGDIVHNLEMVHSIPQILYDHMTKHMEFFFKADSIFEFTHFLE